MNHLKECTPEEVQRVQRLLKHAKLVMQFCEFGLEIADEDFTILLRTLSFISEEVDRADPVALKNELTAFLIHQVLHDRK